MAATVVLSWLLAGGSSNYGGRCGFVQPYSETGTPTPPFQQRKLEDFSSPLVGLDSVRPIRDFFRDPPYRSGNFEPHHELVEDVDGQVGIRAPRLMHRVKP